VATVKEVAQVFVRRLRDAESRPVAGTDGARGPFFSPDGRWLGFFADGRLKKVSLDGGAPRVVCAAPFGRGVWDDDGFIYLSNLNDGADTGISRVHADGGEPEILTRPDRETGETHHSILSRLPRTGALLYAIRQQSNGIRFRVVARDSASGGVRAVINDAGHAQAFADGMFLYDMNGTLYRSRLDEGTLSVQQPAQVVAEGVRGEFFRTSWAATPALVAYDATPRAERRFVWVERNGTAREIPEPSGAYTVPRLSPDNTRIAVEIAAGPDYDAWIYDIARGVLTRFTVDGRSRFPNWTPDGSFITFSRRHAGGHDLYWREADASGEFRQLLNGGGLPTWFGSWSRDLRRFVYMNSSPNSPGDIWTMSPAEGNTPRALLQTPAQEYGGWLSPDDRWLLYTSDRSGRFEVYVKASGDSSLGQQVSPNGGREPRWSPDGREIFYRNGDAMLSVPVAAGARLSFGRPQVLFSGRYSQIGGPGVINYDVSADGKRFLMLQPVQTAPPEIRVLQGYQHLR
jgi:serine/threonine-protein kinase